MYHAECRWTSSSVLVSSSNLSSRSSSRSLLVRHPPSNVSSNSSTRLASKLAISLLPGLFPFHIHHVLLIALSPFTLTAFNQSQAAPHRRCPVYNPISLSIGPSILLSRQRESFSTI